MTRVVTSGEIMLRLKSPQFERLFQSPLLEATFGGGEANVAVSLARFGLDSAFVTVLPKNQLGDAALAELRYHGVDTSLIVRGGERLGIYFLETGTDQRPWSSSMTAVIRAWQRRVQALSIGKSSLTVQTGFISVALRRC